MKTTIKTLLVLALAAPILSAEPDAAVMATGKAAAMLCSACHGPDGQGLQVGPQKMAPTFTGSKILLDDEAVVAAVLKGIKKEGTDYMGVMAPLEAVFKKPDGSFDAEKMTALITFLRNSYDNKAEGVTAEKAQEIFEKYKDRTESMTRAELVKIEDENAKAAEEKKAE